MSANAAFGINARFLLQPATGVQRYAMNVIRAIDAAQTNRANAPVLIAPRGAVSPELANLQMIHTGPLGGHAWEQITLPLRWSGRLLNLCNTAPALLSEQIVCIHDVNSFVSPDSYTFAFRTLYSTLQPLIIRRSARVTTVSHSAARQIARHLPIGVKEIVVLPNGHEHALDWDPSRATIAPAMLAGRTAEDRPFVLAFASRARHKNLALLIQIADELNSLGIDIIIGGGDASIFTSGSLDQRPNVYVTGRVADDELAYLIDRALCLVFPSRTEGFGLPIVEAMARGCPVVSSNTASMPEVCGDAALLASPDDPPAWIAHIKALGATPGLRADLIGRGRDQVRRFSWAETAQGYLDLIERPAVRRPGAHDATLALPNMTVVVATRGRPAIVSATVKHLLANQSHKPDHVIVSCTDHVDAGDLGDLDGVTVVVGPPGLAAQRNTALAILPERTDIVVFFDDDFLATSNWLETAATIFRDEAGLVALTGHVIADGILGPGIGFDEAVRLLDNSAPAGGQWIEPFSPYGCNMAFRVAAIGDARFDERLVLYAWLEDRDFAGTLARRGGRLAKSSEMSGVHMGIKIGRISGERLGYSQIANPLYMLRKGTMTVTQVIGQVSRNMLSNFGRALRPEPFIDRRGRARGNLIAFADLVRGRLKPERALLLGPTAKAMQNKPEGLTP